MSDITTCEAVIILARIFLGFIMGFLCCFVCCRIRTRKNYSNSQPKTKIYDYFYNTSNKQFKMFTYKCPVCGQELEHEVVASLPPKHFYRCNHCDFRDMKSEEMVRLPYINCSNTVLNESKK